MAQQIEYPPADATMERAFADVADALEAQYAADEQAAKAEDAQQCVKVATIYGERSARAQAEARGFAIHHPLQNCEGEPVEDEDGYVITHVKTGLSVAWLFPTIEAAAEGIETLMQLFGHRIEGMTDIESAQAQHLTNEERKRYTRQLKRIGGEPYPMVSIHSSLYKEAQR